MEFFHDPPCKKQRCELVVDDDDLRDETKTKTETGMEDLPMEIISDILSRLPFMSVVRFRLVCPSWRALCRDLLLPEEQLARTVARDPFLLFHCDNYLRSQLSFVELSALDQDRGHTRSKKCTVWKFNPRFSSSMSEFEVVGSCNGLLCLADSFFREMLFVYNPFTGDYMKLPRSPLYADQTVVFGFGFHPVAKEYKVIKIAYYPKPSRVGSRGARRVLQSEVLVLTLGMSPAWRSLGRAPYQIVKMPSETVVNGRLHWVVEPRRYGGPRPLVSFDPADEQFREVPTPEDGPIGRSNCQMMALRGCLSAVVYCKNGRLEIWVMKTYNAKESWTREHIIRSYMPKALKQNEDSMPFKIWKSPNGRISRVVCGLDNGEILLESKSRALVAYDPEKGKFRDILLQGMPDGFHAFVHVGSLSWIKNRV